MSKVLDRELINAVGKNDIKRVKNLIAAGADINSRDKYGQTALIEAVSLGCDEIASALIDAGADVLERSFVDKDSVLHRAAGTGCVKTVKKILGDKVRGKYLINNVSETGETALMAAARHGRADIIALLIECGASLIFTNSTEQTALHIAIWSGEPAAVRTLVNAGSDLYAPDIDGRQPIGIAWRIYPGKKKKEIIEVLEKAYEKAERYGNTR